MKYVAFVLLLVSCHTARADIYKCVKGGQVAYQETPCQGASQQTRLTTESANDLVGCFAMNTASPWTNNTHEDLIEIRPVNGGYGMTWPKDKSRNTSPIMLHRATPETLNEISDGFHVHATDGLTMTWKAGTKNTKPIGIYKVKDATGQQIYMVFLFIANGQAQKIPCDAAHS